jgi:hypothetical protein
MRVGACRALAAWLAADMLTLIARASGRSNWWVPALS